MKRASGTRNTSGRAVRRTRRQQHGDLLRKARKEGLYEALFAFQEGLCGICQRHHTECCKTKSGKLRRFDMDHDHKTMEIRGLLCRACNIKLKHGYTLPWLKGAVRYKEDPPAKGLQRDLSE